MTDTVESKPWYREPWPWIVMSGPALAVVASFASAYVAVHGADPVIDEDYYQRGLHVNVELARARQATELQVSSDLQISGVRRGDEIRVQLRAAQALKDTALRIRLVQDGRPLSERSAVLGRVPGATGELNYFGQWLQAPDDALTLASGRWRVLIEGADWRLEGPASSVVHLAAD